MDWFPYDNGLRLERVKGNKPCKSEHSMRSNIFFYYSKQHSFVITQEARTVTSSSKIYIELVGIY